MHELIIDGIRAASAFVGAVGAVYLSDDFVEPRGIVCRAAAGGAVGYVAGSILARMFTHTTPPNPVPLSRNP